MASAAPYRIYWSIDGNYDGSGYGTANPNDPNDTRWTQEFNYIASQDADNIALFDFVDKRYEELTK